jgi:sterol desaturase/sphingolipid hydroxylase (fatty acid hydroxylase superfamily)
MSAPLIVAAAAGGLSWTFLEYVIHRWLGHDGRYRGNPFGLEHVRHHAEGNYFAPTWKKLIVAAIAAAVLGGPAWLLGGATGLAWAGGLLGLYAGYEILHRREHTHAGIGAYGRWARRHHFHHHFVDPRTNHGVTTPLWDLLFGTYRAPAVIPVPRRLCMAWLLDDAGAIRAEHTPRYVLRGGKS